MAKQWQENSMINFMKRFHQSIQGPKLRLPGRQCD